MLRLRLHHRSASAANQSSTAVRPESLCVSHRAPSHLVHIATRHLRAEQRIVTRYSGDRARLLDGTERPRPLFQSPPRLSHAARLRRPRRQGLATFTGSAPARAVGSLGRALGRRSFQPDKRAPGPPCTEKRSRPHLLTVAAAARPASLRVGPAVLPGRPAGLPGRAANGTYGRGRPAGRGLPLRSINARH